MSLDRIESRGNQKFQMIRSQETLESHDELAWLFRFHPLSPRQKNLAFSFEQPPSRPARFGKRAIVPRDTISANSFRTSQAGREFLSEFLPEEQEEVRNTLSLSKTLTEVLIPFNMRLVGSISQQYVGKGVSRLELIQEGSLGLKNAINTFDPEYSSPRAQGYVQFSSYAQKLIEHSMARAIGEHWKEKGVPYHIAHARKIYRDIFSTLESNLGRSPHASEMRSRIEMQDIFSPEITEYLLMESHTLEEPISLNTPLSIGSEGDQRELHDLLPDPRANTEKSVLSGLTDDIELLREALSSLSVNQRQALLFRTGLGNGEKLTLEQVGRELGGISRERARQLEAQAIKNIRLFVYAKSQGVSKKSLSGQELPGVLPGYKSPFAEENKEKRDVRRERVKRLRNRGYRNTEIGEVLGATRGEVSSDCSFLLRNNEINRAALPSPLLQDQVGMLLEKGKTDLEIAMRLNKTTDTIRRKRGLIELFNVEIQADELSSLTESDTEDTQTPRAAD